MTLQQFINKFKNINSIKTLLHTQTGLFLLGISGWLIFSLYFGVQTIKFNQMEAQYNRILNQSIKQAQIIDRLNKGIEDISIRKNLIDTLVTGINQQIHDLKNVQHYIISTLKENKLTSTIQKSNTQQQPLQSHNQMASIGYIELSNTNFNSNTNINRLSSQGLQDDSKVIDKMTVSYQWQKILENFDYLGIKLNDQ